MKTRKEGITLIKTPDYHISTFFKKREIELRATHFFILGRKTKRQKGGRRIFNSVSYFLSLRFEFFGEGKPAQVTFSVCYYTRSITSPSSDRGKGKGRGHGWKSPPPSLLPTTKPPPALALISPAIMTVCSATMIFKTHSFPFFFLPLVLAGNWDQTRQEVAPHPIPPEKSFSPIPCRKICKCSRGSATHVGLPRKKKFVWHTLYTKVGGRGRLNRQSWINFVHY